MLLRNGFAACVPGHFAGEGLDDAGQSYFLRRRSPAASALHQHTASCAQGGANELGARQPGQRHQHRVAQVSLSGPVLRKVLGGDDVIRKRKQPLQVRPQPLGLHQNRNPHVLGCCGNKQSALRQAPVEVDQPSALQRCAHPLALNLRDLQLGTRGVDAGARAVGAVHDDVGEGRRALAADDVGGVDALLVQTRDDAVPVGVVPHLGDDFRAQPQARDGGEGVAAVASSLHLQVFRAHFVVGLRKGR
mmetsp:Transcript_12122/g.23031  ORF Transcript_12122/g.23031 Transcript_12122/m.23031 type:complete len:247 (+) Transcript_12122:420-1160(+)